jgi:hypothetical protein
LFMSTALDGEYVFEATSKRHADERLARTVIDDGGTPWQGGMVYEAVHLFGRGNWMKGDNRKRGKNVHS